MTQFLAYTFRYDPHLGQPAAWLIYWPWQWISWTVSFYSQNQSLFNQAFRVSILVTVLLFGNYVVFYSLFLRRRIRKYNVLYGSAHFADKTEIQETGLLSFKSKPRSGVYVGAWKDKKGIIRYLRHNGPEHVLAFAPTRSGKGVGLVLPTLLSWQDSVVIMDIKGENWALTSGWRKRQADNLVLKFEPTANDESSVKFNPLEEIRVGTNFEVADVQNIVTMIVDPDGKGLNDHWAKTGHALLVGAVLHLLYKAKKEKYSATLTGVAAILSDPAKSIDVVLGEMLRYPHLDDNTTHPVVSSCARDMLNKAENERSGVLSTAMSFLTLYRDPVVAQNTKKSEFRINDLVNHEKPVSLYLVVRTSDKDRLKPLVRLIINQIMRVLTEKMDFADGQSMAPCKHRLLLMIDEFPSLGRLDVFQESLAYIAGYGLKAYLIVQDLSQLYAAYGRDESILSNCHIRIAYAPNKIETAELLSRMCGTTTVIKKQISSSGKRFSMFSTKVSESYQEISRPLLTPDECMRLPGPKKDSQGRILEAGDMLVFAAGSAPIYGKQILYFKDPIFQERAKISAPLQSDRIIMKSKLRITIPEFNLLDIEL